MPESPQPSPPSRLAKAISNLTPPGATVKLYITLSERTYDEYATAGIAFGRTPEEEIIQRLHKCVNHTSITPLYFNDEEKSELQRALGHPISSAAWVVRKLKELLTLKVDKIDIPIDPKVQARIRSRASSYREPYEKTLKREVTQALERYAGLRPY